MIKHQILVVFICIIIVFWVAYTLRERRKTREKQDQENGNDLENENL